MRAYRITETKVGGLRLAVFEGGEEVAGAVVPTRSDDDREWLVDMAAQLDAFDDLADQEGGADVRSS